MTEDEGISQCACVNGTIAPSFTLERKHGRLRMETSVVHPLFVSGEKTSVEHRLCPVDVEQ